MLDDTVEEQLPIWCVQLIKTDEDYDAGLQGV
jgi:hypothetical protein